jgi:hypothetical protein
MLEARFPKWFFLAAMSLFAVMSAGSSGASAQETETKVDVRETLTAVDNAVNENNILQALLNIEALARDHPQMTGLAAQYFAIVSDAKRAEAAFISSSSFRSPNTNYLPLEAIPATDLILNLATSTRVVIINEAHHISQHRAFTHQLMAALSERGYTHFAAEAFCTTCDEIAPRGIPLVTSGLYVLDPVFGDLVRQSVANGYELVSYEMRPDQLEASYESMEARTEARERAQAENLAKFLRDNPDARVLVHVGFAHVVEGRLGNTELFASKLRAITGIDPLTIDQFEGTPSAIAPSSDPPLYRAFQEKFGAPEIEMAFRNSISDPIGAYAVDVTVVHRRYDDKNGRPGWLSMKGYRTPRLINIEPLDEPTLIRAFVCNEPPKAIPMDQVVAAERNRQVWLMLPEGNYKILRQFRDRIDEPLIENECGKS